MTMTMAPASPDPADDRPAPPAKKSISWNCTVTSARSSAQSTAVREECFDGDALDREFLNGAYSYAEFKRHRAESRGEHASSADENASAVAAADRSNPGECAHHDSSGCFSLEVGEIISSEFLMMKYKQASYNAQFDDSKDRLVAAENSRTEDGAWDVSGTFEYYHSDDGDAKKPRHPPPSGSSLRSSESVLPRLAPVTEYSESSKSNSSTLSHNPSISLEAFGDMHASTATDFSDTDGLMQFMKEEAKKSERIARENNPRAKMGKENEQAAKDTKGKGIAEGSTSANEEEPIAEDDDSIGSLNPSDVYPLANDPEFAKTTAPRITDDSMTTLDPNDAHLPDLRDLHLLGRGTGGMAVAEDSTSSLACLTGRDFAPGHQEEKDARKKKEGATGIAPILEDSISALGFDSRAAASVDTSLNYEVLKAKGTNIIPSAHDSMAAIDVSHLLGVVKDLDAKEKGPDTMPSEQDSKFAIDVSRLQGVVQDLDATNREEPTSDEARESPDEQHGTAEKPARKAKEAGASRGEAVGDRASAADSAPTAKIDGANEQHRREGAKGRGEEGEASGATASTGDVVRSEANEKETVEEKREAGAAGGAKKSQSSFKGGRRSTVDEFLPPFTKDAEGGDAKARMGPGNRPVSRRRRSTVDAERPSLRTQSSVVALTRNINARSKDAKKGLRSHRRASTESARRASTETKDTECRDGSGEDDIIKFDISGSGEERHMKRVSSILYG